MSHREKTYVIFDKDNDLRSYLRMKAWKLTENDTFDFHHGQDLDVRGASADMVKHKLLERMRSFRQVMVLVGDNTKNLYTFVRWELEIAQKLKVPVIAVNLNGKRCMDPSLCPVLLRYMFAIHVSFNPKIIKYALDHFPAEHAADRLNSQPQRRYGEEIYQMLGL